MARMIRPALLFSALLCWLMPVSALALPPGTPSFWVGGDIAGTQLSKLGGAWDSNNFDDVSTAVRVNFGYRERTPFGVEGSLGSLGRYRGTNRDVEYSLASLSLVGHLPLGSEASFYGRLGGGAIYVRSEGQRDTKPAGILGLGLQFELSRLFAMRAGFDIHSFSTSINEAGDKSDRNNQRLDIAYIGFKYRF